ncbi:MAG: peptidoglycan editing factor PgeF [Cellvibrionales bacterium]
MRSGGFSGGLFSSNNLATHVGDNADSVAHNRRQLQVNLGLPSVPHWLDQVHGVDVICADAPAVGNRADGSYSRRSATVCAVLTADCMPVLLCNQAGDQVAAVHAGWRGLAAGILQNAVASFDQPAEQILVFLGPGIGADEFEVGSDVRQAFMATAKDTASRFLVERAFRTRGDRYVADLYALARIKLQSVGVGHIYGGNCCTVSDGRRFYSYRRDLYTGRNASLIWLC